MEQNTDSALRAFDPKSVSQQAAARKEIERLESENEKLVVRHTANQAAINALKQKLPPSLIHAGIKPLSVK